MDISAAQRRILAARHEAVSRRLTSAPLAAPGGMRSVVHGAASAGYRDCEPLVDRCACHGASALGWPLCQLRRAGHASVALPRHESGPTRRSPSEVRPGGADVCRGVTSAGLRATNHHGHLALLPNHRRSGSGRDRMRTPHTSRPERSTRLQLSQRVESGKAKPQRMQRILRELR